MKTKNGIPMLPTLNVKQLGALMRGCGDKRTFDDESKAQSIIRKILLTPGDHSTLCSYVCPICKGIHIGHSEQRRKHVRQSEKENRNEVH